MGVAASANLSVRWSVISPKPSPNASSASKKPMSSKRHCFAEVPPRVEYSLTAKGHALLPVIESMREFGNRWLPGDDCHAEVGDED